MLKERIIELLSQEIGRPMMDREIMAFLAIDHTEEAYLKEALDELVADGRLIVTKKRKYGTPQMFSMVSGKIQLHQKGFGFVMPDPGQEDGDIFIPPSELMGAMNGDRVLAKITKRAQDGKRIEGKIEQIVKRENSEVVGTFQESNRAVGFGFVLADDKRIHKDIFVSGSNTLGAQSGDKVVVKITRWGTEDKNPEGEVVVVIGKKGEPGVDILSVIKRFKLPETFPNKVLKEADRIEQTIDEASLKGRRDFRNDLVVTIDGEDAKDLDDAITVKKLENGNYELGVHIADVSNYVKEGGALDAEALKRGTSVYLIDRVIPMLPERLSNGICSLNPDVDRLTLSCIMEIDKQGRAVNHEICESVIRSKARMTYTIVSNVLEGKMDPAYERYAHLFDTFKLMEELALILRKKRMDRGAIDFDFPEPKVILDTTGKPIDIKAYDRRIANRIIEEFMLAANETVAEHFFWMEAPFVYRIHEDPSEDKIAAFSKFIHNFGYTIKGAASGEIHPRAVQDLLSQVEGTKEEAIINRLMLRSLKQAKYSPVDSGHFGLAAEHYCHFTSPIRRYPDLQIHRIIREYITGTIDETRINRLHGIVANAAGIASERERLADQAERDVDDMKKAEYMEQFIGEEFDGVISSVTGFGMFIALPNTVEGLVRLADMNDDYYVFDDERLCLTGERKKQRYTIGDRLVIKVEGVNVDAREIDFSIVSRIND